MPQRARAGGADSMARASARSRASGGSPGRTSVARSSDEHISAWFPDSVPLRRSRIGWKTLVTTPFALRAAVVLLHCSSASLNPWCRGSSPGSGHATLGAGVVPAPARFPVAASPRTWRGRPGAELVDAALAARADGDADAERHGHRLALDAQRLGEGGEDALGDLGRLVRALTGLQQHAELVAAEARRRVGGAQGSRAAAGRRRRAARTPTASPRESLTSLKSSRSRKEHGDRLVVARLARERVLDAVVGGRTVGDWVERVVEGSVAELLLEGAPVVHVARVGATPPRRGSSSRFVATVSTWRQLPFGCAMRSPPRATRRPGRPRHRRGRVPSARTLVGMRRARQAGADGPPASPAEHRLDRAGQRADRAVALEDRDEVGEFWTIDCQARLALPVTRCSSSAVSMRRAAPARRRRAGPRARARRPPRAARGGRPRREQPDRGRAACSTRGRSSRRRRARAAPRRPARRAGGRRTRRSRRGTARRARPAGRGPARRGDPGSPTVASSRRRGAAEPRIGEGEDGPLRRASGRRRCAARGRARARPPSAAAPGPAAGQQHRHEHELHGPRAAGADVELDQ